MLLGKKGNKYIENNLAEMLALVGGAMKYNEIHGNLNGYEEHYLENRRKSGFYYKMQRYGDKIIRKELRDVGIHCKKKRTKRFYRYFEKGSKRIDSELYDYFKYIMDYILNDDMLTKILTNEILGQCGCKKESENGNCLNQILDWHYKRLIKYKTDLTQTNEKKKEKAKNLLDKLNKYPKFGRFRTLCQTAHGILIE